MAKIPTNRCNLFISVVLLVMLSQVGATTAESSDEKYPRELLAPDCPEIIDVPRNETITMANYTDCQESKYTRSVKREYWDLAQTAEGIGNWCLKEGNALQESDLLVVNRVGSWLKNFGDGLVEKSHEWKGMIRRY